MILALKAADLTTQVWLIADAKTAPPAPSLSWESGRRLSDELLAQITTLLAQKNSSLADLKGCIIFSGPGSFTSLRIGHSVMNALADGLNIPVIGVRGEHWLADGLAGLAQAALHQPAMPYYGAEAHITRPRA